VRWLYSIGQLMSLVALTLAAAATMSVHESVRRIRKRERRHAKLVKRLEQEQTKAARKPGVDRIARDSMLALYSLQEPTLPRALQPRQATSIAQLLTEGGDVLDADDLITSHGLLDHLSLTQKLALARELRLRGFLQRALPYTQAAARADERYINLLELRRTEVEVLSGAFFPSLSAAVVHRSPGRVLHVVGKTLPSAQSGYTLRTHYTALSQLAAGVDVHVVGQAGLTKHEKLTVEHIDGVPYHRPPGPFHTETNLVRWMQHNTEQLAVVARELSPAVIHVHSDFLNAICAQAVGDAMNIPVVYETRGFWEETWRSRTCQAYGWSSLADIERKYGMPEAYAWRQQREAECRERAAHVLTLARVMADHITDLGLPREKVSISPNAVDVAAFPIATRNHALAETLGIGSEEFVVGYISSLVEYEGIDTLIDAVAQLNAVTTTRLRLLLVGDGIERAKLETQAAALGLTNVIFTGTVPHDLINSYYGLLDIFVIPRRPVDVCHMVPPLKPFEAFSTGRTVVLSDVKALSEIAEDSGAAMLFEAGNAESLARVLRELVEAPELRRALAERGAAWVRKERGWDANVAVHRRVYEALAAPSEAPVDQAAATRN
jgi:glycosyltransferase involved in cell wall biosynthesis